MTLSNEAVIKYKNIFEKEFGKKLSMEEAKKSAENLINFFEVLIEADRDQKHKAKLIHAVSIWAKITKDNLQNS